MYGPRSNSTPCTAGGAPTGRREPLGLNPGHSQIGTVPVAIVIGDPGCGYLTGAIGPSTPLDPATELLAAGRLWRRHRQVGLSSVGTSRQRPRPASSLSLQELPHTQALRGAQFRARRDGRSRWSSTCCSPRASARTGVGQRSLSHPHVQRTEWPLRIPSSLNRAPSRILWVRPASFTK